MKIRSLCVNLLVLLAAPAQGYDEINHQEIAGVAVMISVLGTDQVKRERVGLRLPISNEKQTFPDSERRPRTVLNLVKDGARLEDGGARSLHHFYNPQTESALQIPQIAARYPYDWLPVGIATINQFTTKSPERALVATANEYSYKQFKSHYLQALTAADQDERNDHMGHALQAIGHIVHHVQDMAQPQHVRNDMHLYDESREACDQTVLGQIGCDAYYALRARSTYEQWTKEANLEFNDFVTYPVVYSKESIAFTAPAHFWKSAGRGLAEFTNRNFLSAGTMFVAPPVVSGSHDEMAADLCARVVWRCEVQDLDHVVTFWHSAVDDQLKPEFSNTNSYAAAASIFEWDFRSVAPNGQRPYVGNRFTFERAHAYLLPRAIAYSAGFINYMFRGDLAIDLPDQGAFAVLDLHPNQCVPYCAFSYVKLKVKNTTEGEAMGPGTIRLVAKFRQNQCFRVDLSGEDGGFAFGGPRCRSAREEVRVSKEVPVSSVSTNFSSTTKFMFDHVGGIPINVSDLSFQVIFRGKLGEEEDAIVVSTLDVSEPNYVAVGNLTDYVFYEGDDRYSPLKVGDYPITLNTVSFSFKDPASAPPLATVTSLGGGQHAQFAFITTKGTPRFWLRTQSSPPFGYTDNAPFRVEEFFRDDYDDKSTYSRTCQVVLERGQYRQYSMYYAQTTHGRFSEAAPGGTLSGVRSEDERSMAKYAADCRGSVAPGTNGLLDLSYLTPYNAANAKSWTINFP